LAHSRLSGKSRDTPARPAQPHDSQAFRILRSRRLASGRPFGLR